MSALMTPSSILGSGPLPSPRATVRAMPLYKALTVLSNAADKFWNIKPIPDNHPRNALVGCHYGAINRPDGCYVTAPDPTLTESVTLDFCPLHGGSIRAIAAGPLAYVCVTTHQVDIDCPGTVTLPHKYITRVMGHIDGGWLYKKQDEAVAAIKYVQEPAYTRGIGKANWVDSDPATGSGSLIVTDSSATFRLVSYNVPFIDTKQAVFRGPWPKRYYKGEWTRTPSRTESERIGLITRAIKRFAPDVQVNKSADVTEYRTDELYAIVRNI